MTWHVGRSDSEFFRPSSRSATALLSPVAPCGGASPYRGSFSCHTASNAPLTSFSP